MTTSLFEAIRSRSPTAVAEALRAEGDPAITARDARGWTPLMAAAAKGHAGIARILLRAALRVAGVAGLREVATGPDGLDVLQIAGDRGHRPTFGIFSAWLLDDGVFRRNFPGDDPEPGFDRGGGATVNRLVAAAAAGHIEEVDSCLARGVEVDGYDSRSRQAMREAISNGHDEVVRALIAAGADPDEQSNFWTTLIRAAEAGHPAVILALVDGGADPHGVQALRENALMKAVEKGHRDATKVLIGLGIDVNARDGNGRSALARAIENWDDEMADMLKAAGAVEPGEAGKRLLAAARDGNLRRVLALIGEGADLSAADPIHNWTALRKAVEWQHGPIVDALLAAGALGLEPDESRGALIARAVYHRQRQIVQALLAAGADPDGDDGYRTALGQAAENGDLEIVRLLLDAGADPDKDPGGGSSLVFALQGGNPEVIATLRARGAEKRYGGLRLEELRGAGSFDVNDMWLLVRAPIEEAGRAFAEARGGAIRRDRDVYSRTIAISPLCYAAFRLRGHSWTLIRELRCDDNWFGFVDESDAEEVSRRLGGRAIHYGISDTAGAVGYALYESGTCLEHMEYGGGMDSESEEPVATFSSLIRPHPAGEIAAPYEFTDAFLREQEAFAPAFGLAYRLAAGLGEITFRFGSMEPDDFERVDVIHLPEGAVSARMKVMRESQQMRESRPDQRAEPGIDEDPGDDDDIPF
jgi:ankyrin repeat protein